MDIEEIKDMYEEIKHIQYFLEEFVNKTVVCDPIDRPIGNDSDDSDPIDQGTKIAELKEMFSDENMTAFDGQRI